jgi:hypothetical protein
MPQTKGRINIREILFKIDQFFIIEKIKKKREITNNPVNIQVSVSIN